MVRIAPPLHPWFSVLFRAFAAHVCCVCVCVCVVCVCVCEECLTAGAFNQRKKHAPEPGQDQTAGQNQM